MSDRPAYYKIARTTEQLCGLLDVDPAAVMRRTRMPPDFLENEGRGVTASEFFEGWNAIVEEAGRADLPLFLGQAYARGPFIPAFFAFTCSPTVAIGLERLALFKPLTGPLLLTLVRTDRGFQIRKSTIDATLPMPATFAATELVFMIEAIRTCTGAPVRAQAARLPEPVPCLSDIEDFIGCEIQTGGAPNLTLSLEDADRVLLSRDPAQWALVEAEMRRQLDEINGEMSHAARLRSVLADMLPAGASGLAEAARRLRLSTRSLQRHLHDEGMSFQALLDETRQRLALHYLRETELNIEEISYLLAYRDPNSFYRAFHVWTGMTPLAARMERRQD